MTGQGNGDDIYSEIRPAQPSMAREVAMKRGLTTRETSISETVKVLRGKYVRLVGHKGGMNINLDIHSGHDVTCAEVDREAAQRLVYLLCQFLGVPEEAPEGPK